MVLSLAKQFIGSLMVAFYVIESSCFSPSIASTRFWTYLSCSRHFDSTEKKVPAAALVGSVSNEERRGLEQALIGAEFRLVHEASDADFLYSFSKATGMLQLQPSAPSCTDRKNGNLRDHTDRVPRWIPLVKNMENILVANGWSFLDPDENDPLSPFDLEAPTLESTYVPKWKSNDEIISESSPMCFSRLGYSLHKMSGDDIEQTNLRSSLSRSVLLEGATDPPGIKETHNGISFAGSVRDIPEGIFVCAIGGLPLFTTKDLSPSTASSGWLTFWQPISSDHVELFHPNHSSTEKDKRIEVLCAKTKCHLGHYFGIGSGYCINASALNFVPSDMNTVQTLQEQLPWVYSTLLRTQPF